MRQVMQPALRATEISITQRTCKCMLCVQFLCKFELAELVCTVRLNC